MEVQSVSLRARTGEVLYRLISEHGEMSRPDLAVATGMSRSTVNQAVSRLMRDGRIAEAQQRPKGPGSGSGRPATGLVAIRVIKPVGAIDFGHSHVQVAIADPAGVILGEARTELDVDLHATDALDAAARMIGELSREHDVASLSSVVAGIPGPLDSRTGIVRSPTILSSWVTAAPAEQLGRRLGVPVRVENDAVLGAYGEARRGAGRMFPDFLYVKISSGIGAGLIIGGRPFRGSTGLAGEIGHVRLNAHNEPCRCGNRGCLEAVISTRTIADQIRLVQPAGQCPDSEQVTDAVARIYDEAGRSLGRVLAAFCDLVNPGALILGGELGAGHPDLMRGVQASITRHCQPATAAAMRVLPAALGVRAELLGALELSLQGATAAR